MLHERGSIGAVTMSGGVPAVASQAALASAEMDAAAAYRLVWRYRRVVAGCFVAFMVAALIVTLLRTPMYQAEVTIEIVAPTALVPNGAATQGVDVKPRALQTARSHILSRELAIHVVDQLGLASDPRLVSPVAYFSPPKLWGMAAQAQMRIGNAGEATQVTRRQIAAENLREQVSADVVRNTAILSVRYRHAEPDLAAAIANQVADSYVARAIDRHQNASEQRRARLQRQVEQARRDLATSQIAVIEYARINELTLEEGSAELLAGRIEQVNARLTAVLALEAELDALVGQIEAGNTAGLPAARDSAAIAAMRLRAIELRAAYEEGRATFQPGYPAMREKAAQIREIERQIGIETAAIAADTLARRDRALAEAEALRAELGRLAQRQTAIERRSIRHAILEGQVTTDRARLDTLLAALNGAAIGQDAQPASAIIMDRAVPPDRPIAPSLPINIAVAFLLGGLTSAAAISIGELRRAGFADASEVEADLGLPVLATLPVRSGAPAFKGSNRTGSRFAEAHRILRTALEASGVGHTVTALVVTSPGRREGRTTLVYRLGREFASIGRRVLLIDGDLRQPRLHRLAKVPNDFGLTDLLARQRAGVHDRPLFRAVPDAGIAVLPAGAMPDSPADLLASDRMATLLDHCRRHFDIVLIDAPAVEGLSDAGILARLADATLLAVVAERTAREAAQTAVGRLAAVGGRIVGVCLSDFTDSPPQAAEPKASPGTTVRAASVTPARAVEPVPRAVPDHGPGPYMPDIRGRLL